MTPIVWITRTSYSFQDGIKVCLADQLFIYQRCEYHFDFDFFYEFCKKYELLDLVIYAHNTAFKVPLLQITPSTVFKMVRSVLHINHTYIRDVHFTLILIFDNFCGKYQLLSWALFWNNFTYPFCTDNSSDCFSFQNGTILFCGSIVHN